MSEALGEMNFPQAPFLLFLIFGLSDGGAVNGIPNALEDLRAVLRDGTDPDVAIHDSAAAIGLNPILLARKFSEQFGLSPSDWQASWPDEKKRLEAAAQANEAAIEKAMLRLANYFGGALSTTNIENFNKQFEIDGVKYRYFGRDDTPCQVKFLRTTDYTSCFMALDERDAFLLSVMLTHERGQKFKPRTHSVVALKFSGDGKRLRQM